MIVLKRTKKGYSQDPTKHFKFERFEKECGDFVLVEAAFEDSDKWDQFDLTKDYLSMIKSKKILRLEFEEPNKFFLGDKMENYDNEFHRIYTLCPYTSNWMNKKINLNKRVPIFFPFNENDIPNENRKIYDVIYTGHIVSPILLKDLNTISKFNYRFVSNDNHELVTNKNASYNEKLKLISETKVTIVHNLLYPKIEHIFNIWKYDDWVNNGAFKLIPRKYKFWNIWKKNIVVPQLKSRVFEAAFSRSLILCKKDDFNVIENFFEPGKEFLYYNEDNLEKVLSDVLNNYHKYESIISNAYNRAIKNYTTKAFVETYLRKID